MSTPKLPDNDTSNGAFGDAFGKVSERVSAVYSAAREKTADAGQTLEANPLGALLGGIAIGAIAGVLLPRIEKEKELLAPIGARIGDAARAALEAGKGAGIDALTEAGFSPEQLRGQVSKLAEQALKAVGTAGTAAVDAARNSGAR